jgi:hypothetical protein
MTDDAYLAGIEEMYDGEVRGERLMLALHAVAKTPRDAWQFANVLQLETETKARLRRLLLRRGLSVAETADLSSLPGRVAGYVERSWRDYAAATATRLEPIVERYEAIAALGPAEDQDILRAVVAHEAALVEWARIEAGGPSDRSLDWLVSLLKFPIDRLV